MTNVFIVHHNPNNGRYTYDADPADAVASARALLDAAEITWVAGNCWRMLRVGDPLLFKFGGQRLKQAPGLYAAAVVSKQAARSRAGYWVFSCKINAALTRHLIQLPIVGGALKRVIPRSFGASIQRVSNAGCDALAVLLGPTFASVLPRHVEPLTRGLLIMKEPMDAILSGRKTWEIRGSNTSRRGPIALIQSASGTVVGTCDLVDVRGPLRLEELKRHVSPAGFRLTELPYRDTYAWVLANARRLEHPIPYRHPPGAIIWVKLQQSVVRALAGQRYWSQSHVAGPRARAAQLVED